MNKETLKYYKEIQKLKNPKIKLKKEYSTVIGVLIFLGLIAFAVFSVPIIKAINQFFLNSTIPDKIIEKLIPIGWGIILIIVFISNIIMEYKNKTSANEKDVFYANQEDYQHKIINWDFETNWAISKSPEFSERITIGNSLYNIETFTYDRRNLDE